MPKTVSAIIIYYLIGGTKIYVSDIQNAGTKRIAVGSRNIDDAQPFENETKAQKAIGSCYNPPNIEYHTEAKDFPEDVFNAIRLRGIDDFK